MAKNESAENYLETILILSKKLPVVRSVDIATELGYKKSSVSVAMKHLREHQHITVTDAGFIYLTESGKEIAEVMIYPSFYNRADMPHTKKKRETKPSQRNLNDKNARRYVIRLANINFGSGDIWATFGWDDRYIPEDIERAKKDVTNFIKRVNRKRKKRGFDNMKYIYVLAVDDYTRPHFHILMSGDGVDRDELEAMWGKCKRPNTRRVKPDEDFGITGLATYISQNPHGTKRWCSSKNLKKPPEPTRSYRKFKKRRVEKMAKDHETLKQSLEKEYVGYRFLDAEVKFNTVTAAFYIYARMTRD